MGIVEITRVHQRPNISWTAASRNVQHGDALRFTDADISSLVRCIKSHLGLNKVIQGSKVSAVWSCCSVFRIAVLLSIFFLTSTYLPVGVALDSSHRNNNPPKTHSEGLYSPRLRSSRNVDLSTRRNCRRLPVLMVRLCTNHRRKSCSRNGDLLVP